LRSVSRPSEAPQQILLPGLKMDLAVVLMVVLCLALSVVALDLPHWLDLAVLGGGSGLAAAWLAWRVRRFLARLENNATLRRDHGQK